MALDVTEATFQAEVLDRSVELPVVVDFWAEWCAPCRALSPLIESVAAEHEGKVVLAKLDTEANPALAQAFRVQSIPAVKAFRDGVVVDEFLGAHPRPAIERFFAKLVPSEAQELAASGDEASLRRAVELDPRLATAAVPLARILHANGDPDAALAVLEPIVGNFAADGLAARIALERAGKPDLGDAFAALDAGEHERALTELIAEIEQADGAKEDLRKVVVGVLDELGAASPVARDYRRRLASALY